jgi:hypothetical protein
MSQFVLLGPDAKVRLNTQIYAVVSGQYREVADVADTTDTESTGYKENKGGNKQLEVTLTAQKSTAVAPHIAPMLLRAGSTCALILYPGGTGRGGYEVASFRLREFQGDFRVEGSAPQQFTFSGVSNGTYTVPGD